MNATLMRQMCCLVVRCRGWMSLANLMLHSGAAVTIDGKQNLTFIIGLRECRVTTLASNSNTSIDHHDQNMRYKPSFGLSLAAASTMSGREARALHNPTATSILPV